MYCQETQKADWPLRILKKQASCRILLFEKREGCGVTAAFSKKPDKSSVKRLLKTAEDQAGFVRGTKYPFSFLSLINFFKKEIRDYE